MAGYFFLSAHITSSKIATNSAIFPNALVFPNALLAAVLLPSILSLQNKYYL
jgi:hypothetical protein